MVENPAISLKTPGRVGPCRMKEPAVQKGSPGEAGNRTPGPGNSLAVEHFATRRCRRRPRPGDSGLPSQYGKTPTPASPSTSRPKRGTRDCNSDWTDSHHAQFVTTNLCVGSRRSIQQRHNATPLGIGDVSNFDQNDIDSHHGMCYTLRIKLAGAVS